MKKLIVAAAIAAFSVTTASAADIAARPYTKAPPLASAYSWTGFYAGVNAGYGWNDPSVSYSPNDAVTVGAFTPAFISPASWNNSGALGGGQIGYNYQFDRQWVVGLEADIAATDIKGSGATTNILGADFETTVASQKVEWFGTVRGRLGWLPTDRLLIFGTGGLAYGSVKENVVLTTTTQAAGGGGFGFACVAGQPCFVGSSSGVRAGWTAGAGLEYAFLQNLTVKAEYLYVDLGDDTVRTTAVNGNGNTPSSFSAAFSGVSFNVVRAGLNYKF